MASDGGGITDEVLRALVGERALAAGRAYVRSGRVLEVTEQLGGTLITAMVQGNRPAPYHVFVRRAGGGRWSGHCSCPITYDCKHVAAAALAARGSGPAPAPAVAPPAWETLLDPLVRARDDGGEGVGTPWGLHLEVTGLAVTAPQRQQPTYSLGPRIAARVVTRSAQGRWVRSGNSWHDVQHEFGNRRRPVQRKALRDLLSASMGAGNLYLAGSTPIYLDEFGISLWPLLEQVARSGVEIVTGKGAPVLLASPVALSLDLRRRGDGLVLHPALTSGPHPLDATAVLLVGDPVSGILTADPDVLAALGTAAAAPQPYALALAPLGSRPDEAVTRLVREGRDVHIPEADVPRFLRAYYPALARLATVTSLDGSVTPPELRPPVLQLQVRFTAGPSAQLRWGFVYRSDGEPDLRVGLDRSDAGGVVRDRATEEALVATVSRACARIPEDIELTGMQVVDFVADEIPLLQGMPGVEVVVTGTVPEFRLAEQSPVITLATSEAPGQTDWFDLSVTVSLEGEDVPFAELFAALALEQTHLVLDSGLYLTLDSPQLHALKQLIEEARSLQDKPSGGTSIHLHQAGLWEELRQLGVVETQSSRWAQTVSGLLDLEQVECPPLPGGFTGELRAYQREGFRWLAFLWRHGLGGILADDMGLGKTVQTLALVCHALETRALPGPFLVVAPTSVVGNWAREAERFAPGLRVVTVTETTRRSHRPLREDVAGADLVITSYALFRIDAEHYAGQAWSGLILDEAQFVKNHEAKTYQCARRLEAPFKLAVTGTPLENSLMDLWSLLSIVAPGLYPSPQRFTEDVRRPIERGDDPELLDRLRRRIRPLVLRRTKELVAAELPPKQEQVLDVLLNPKHDKIYQTHLQRERKKVLGLLGDLDRNRFEIFRSLTLLRQLALSPGLVDEKYASTPSSKVDVLMETLGEVLKEGHRALVFSQFTGFLGVVRERLDDERIPYSYLDGRTRKRSERIAEFREGTNPVFLISLKAGGVGLNLTEADYCFLLDPWWNPAVEAQAVDRTHRIGQDKTVMVYRLVATGTIEEKVMELKARKQALFDRVLDDGELASAPMTADDIRGLFS